MSAARPQDGRGSIIVLILIVLLAGSGIVFVIRLLSQDPIEEALSGDRVINTLFIFEDEGAPLASFVFMYYPRTRRVAIFSVPGEVGRILPSIGRVDRIDRVYSSARAGPYEEAIESLLDLDITFHIVYDMDALVRLVDLLEGVDIFIPQPVAIYGEVPVFFPSGLVRLDGDKARTWMTYTDPSGDGDAAGRRQRFFLGLIRRFRERGDVLSSPVLSVWFGETMRTGMNQRTWKGFFGEFAGIDTDRLSVQTVGGTRREVSGQSLLIPYYEGSQIKEFVRHAFSSLTRPSEGPEDERVFTVEVQNGTATAGLAARTAELLRGFGYEVISVTNADRNNYEATHVIDHSGYREVARTLADVIKCGSVRYEQPRQEDPAGPASQSIEYRADITLVIGKDFNGRYVAGGRD